MVPEPEVEEIVNQEEIYAVTFNWDGLQGSVSGYGDGTVKKGGYLPFTVTAYEGFAIGSVTATDGNLSADFGDENSTQYTLGNINSNTTVNVSFYAKPVETPVETPAVEEDKADAPEIEETKPEEAVKPEEAEKVEMPEEEKPEVTEPEKTVDTSEATEQEEKKEDKTVDSKKDADEEKKEELAKKENSKESEKKESDKSDNNISKKKNQRAKVRTQSPTTYTVLRGIGIILTGKTSEKHEWIGDSEYVKFVDGMGSARIEIKGLKAGDTTVTHKYIDDEKTEQEERFILRIVDREIADNTEGISYEVASLNDQENNPGRISVNHENVFIKDGKVENVNGSEVLEIKSGYKFMYWSSKSDDTKYTGKKFIPTEEQILKNQKDDTNTYMAYFAKCGEYTIQYWDKDNKTLIKQETVKDVLVGDNVTVETKKDDIKGYEVTGEL